jgi:hypothetical protein
MVGQYQKYLDCVRGAQALTHKLSPPAKRTYLPWHFCRRELVDPSNLLVVPPHIVP